MNLNQKLRYLITIYWQKLWIEDLYPKYKTKVLCISKANDLDSEQKLNIINSFIVGIEWIDTGIIDRKLEKERLINLINDNKW